jgi:hypothetical protein
VGDWVRKNYLRVLIGAGLILLLALPTVLTRSAKPVAAGWDDLVFCLDLVSFDGKKSLTLADDGIATMEDKTSGSAKATSGTWEVSGQRDRYLIKFGDQEASFERIAPPGADMCILAAGSAYAADLRQSWFAIRPDDGPPDEQ